MDLREVIRSPSHPNQDIPLDVAEKDDNFIHFHLFRVLAILVLSSLRLP